MVEIIAHRGSSGNCPENTMSAFLEAEKVGSDGIEMDIQFTKDRVLVVTHDEIVDRTTNGTGKVCEYTLNELKKLDAGAKHPNHHKKEEILTLKEYLDWASTTNLILNIELKYSEDTYPEFEADVLALLDTYDLGDRLIISSFNSASLVKITKMAPQLQLGMLYEEEINQPDEYIKRLGVGSLHPPKEMVDEKFITKAKEKQIPVRTYTVNSEKELKRFLRMECTAIITDFPELALRIRNEI